MNLTGEALLKWEEGKRRSNETRRLQRLKRIEEYEKNPVLCSFCKRPLPYEFKKNHRKFCDSSCSAKCNNSKDGPWNPKVYYQKTREKQIQKTLEWRRKSPENLKRSNEWISKSAKKRKFQDPAGYLLASARDRVKKNGLPFSIVKEDVIIPEYCPVLGIPLYFQNGGRIDNTPTIDRIIPEKGYVKGNILVISWRANRLRNDATLEELKKITSFYEKLSN